MVEYPVTNQLIIQIVVRLLFVYQRLGSDSLLNRYVSGQERFRMQIMSCDPIVQRPYVNQNKNFKSAYVKPHVSI